MRRLAFLWHMHQPVYVDPLTGESILPWVRLHATRAYYDMGRALETFGDVRATVNFTPCLVKQLEAFVDESAKDRFLTLSSLPPSDLSATDRQQIVRHFFMVNWDTGVWPIPRYGELLEKRGRDLSRVNLAEAATAFSEEELRDLQVLFNLAWMGFSAREEDETVAALLKKGRAFSELDKAALLAAQTGIVARILPLWRKLSERGQVELSTTPFNHPILPLVIDTDAGRRAMPQARLPLRFTAPDDAREQVRRALAQHARVFGALPRGMWPAEGSVSPEALAMLASEGVQWAASDEGVLAQSAPADLTGAPNARFQPWRVAAGDRDIAMIFRDHALSDLVGFTYSKNDPAQAVQDFVGRVAATPDGSLVSVILDGENAWEHYPNSGRDFFRALYDKLSSNGESIRTTTVSDAIAETAPTSRITAIHSGSWIDANYRIWIGHPEDNAAWEEIRRARLRLEARRLEGTMSAEIANAALDLILIAEGSDWFWWYGDDFATETKVEFDALFRRHLEKVWRLLGEAPPAQLAHPIAAISAARRAIREPTALIHPRIDGKLRAYFEWRGAGCYTADADHGSMHGGPAAFSALHFGFDLERLYLRLDPASEASHVRDVAQTLNIFITAAGDREWSTTLALDGSAPTPEFIELALDKIIELAIPFSLLNAKPRTGIKLAVRVLRGDVEIERLPRVGFIALDVPDSDFERVQWMV